LSTIAKKAFAAGLTSAQILEAVELANKVKSGAHLGFGLLGSLSVQSLKNVIWYLNLVTFIVNISGESQCLSREGFIRFRK
jgi:hypothetical protein